MEDFGNDNDNQDELDQISTVALLIDDLSSEDPSAKLHSIQRLLTIAQILGPDRTADELIPMLTELIEKIDCNPELMMQLSEQLGNLTQLLQTNEQIVLLLDPLEILVGNDDQVVRDKAITSMKKVGSLLNKDSIKDQYLPLLKRLRKGDLFSMRISACFLYADIYKKLDNEQKQVIRKKFTKLSKDDTPMVRRGAAQSIQTIAAHLESQHAKEFLLPIIKALLEDQNDSVKINAVQSSIDVAKAVNDSILVQDVILPSFKSSCENRFSWRLRFSVAENAANLCKYIENSDINYEIVAYYELLLRDAEPEVRSEAVANVPTVSKYCQSQILIDKILPILKEQMATDQSQHVKGSMAKAICELSENISKQDIIEYILPPIITILKDSTTEVKVSLLENISKLALSLGEENVSLYIIPEIEKTSLNQIWRVRRATIGFIPSLLDFVSKQLFQEKIQPILERYLEDSVHQIRLEAIQCLIQLKKKHFNQDWLEQILLAKMQLFCTHQKFALRIHTLFIINEVLFEVSDQFINEKIYKLIMKKLAHDQVPNIRFNFAKTAQMMYKKLSNSNKMDCADQLKNLAEKDSDFDVKFYASKTLSETFRDML